MSCWLSDKLNTLKWTVSDIKNGIKTDPGKLLSPTDKAEYGIAAEPITPVEKPDRELNYLYPPFRKDVELLLDRCHAEGLMLYVFEGRRSPRRQLYLYEQGRTRPGKIVTNAQPGHSAHNFGLGIDLVFDADTYKPGQQWAWNGDYKKLGEIIKDSFPNLEHAATWKRFPEQPHVQNLYGFQMSQLKAIYDEAGGGEAGMVRTWFEIDRVLAKIDA